MARAADPPLYARRPYAFALVFIGGALGTASRDALTESHVFDAAASIWVINVVGSLLLGLVIAIAFRGESLRGGSSPGPRFSRRSHTLRLLLGSGFLGGFTTYSAFAVLVAAQTGAGDPLGALMFGVSAVVAGFLACWLGLVIGSIGSQRLEEPQA